MKKTFDHVEARRKRIEAAKSKRAAKAAKNRRIAKAAESKRQEKLKDLQYRSKASHDPIKIVSQEKSVVALGFTPQEINDQYLDFLKRIPGLRHEIDNGNLLFLKDCHVFKQSELGTFNTKELILKQKLEALKAEELSLRQKRDTKAVIAYVKDNMNHFFKLYPNSDINFVFLDAPPLKGTDEEISDWQKIMLEVEQYYLKNSHSLPHRMTFRTLERDRLGILCVKSPISAMSGTLIGVMLGTGAAIITLCLISGALTLGFGPLIAAGAIIGGLAGYGGTESRWVQNRGYLNRQAASAAIPGMLIGAGIALAAATVVLGVFTAGIAPLVIGAILTGCLLFGALAGGITTAGIYNCVNKKKEENAPVIATPKIDHEVEAAKGSSPLALPRPGRNPLFQDQDQGKDEDSGSTPVVYPDSVLPFSQNDGLRKRNGLEFRYSKEEMTL